MSSTTPAEWLDAYHREPEAIIEVMRYAAVPATKKKKTAKKLVAVPHLKGKMVHPARARWARWLSSELPEADYPLAREMLDKAFPVVNAPKKGGKKKSKGLEDPHAWLD